MLWLPLRFLRAILLYILFTFVGCCNRVIFYYCLPKKIHSAILAPYHKKGGFHGTEVKVEDLLKDLGSWKCQKSLFWTLVAEVRHGWVDVGDKIPNFSLTQLFSDGTTKEVNLLDFTSPGRPLVMNIGSCT